MPLNDIRKCNIAKYLLHLLSDRLLFQTFCCYYQNVNHRVQCTFCPAESSHLYLSIKFLNFPRMTASMRQAPFAQSNICISNSVEVTFAYLVVSNLITKFPSLSLIFRRHHPTRSQIPSRTRPQMFILSLRSLIQSYRFNFKF